MTLFRIYATHPDGQNRIAFITQSGRVNDPSKVIHDERTQGPMPQAYIDADAALNASEDTAANSYRLAVANNRASARTKLLARGFEENEARVILGMNLVMPMSIEPAMATADAAEQPQRPSFWKRHRAKLLTSGAAAAASAAYYFFS